MSILSRLRFPSGIIPTIAATTAILCLGGGIPHAQAAGPDTSTSATGVPAASKASPSSQTPEPPAHAPGPVPSPADMRTVTDDDGKTVKIPSSPERIVVMHEPLLGIPLMDLGLEPIGAYGRNREGGFVTAVDFIDTVFGPGHAKPQGFGALGQIDLERLRSLKPDLIVGSRLDIGKRDQLASVAPVYIQNGDQQHVCGFGVETDLARVLGRQKAYDERLKIYEEQLAAVKEKLPPLSDGHRPRTYLAVLLTDQINVVGCLSGGIQALRDLGYTQLQTGGRAEGGKLGSTLMAPISAEAFGKLDPDLLVIMNNYTKTVDAESGARASLDRILPGWERFMRPAREGRVLFMDSSRVTTPSIQSALHALDAVQGWAVGNRNRP